MIAMYLPEEVRLTIMDPPHTLRRAVASLAETVCDDTGEDFVPSTLGSTEDAMAAVRDPMFVRSRLTYVASERRTQASGASH
jgi:hypothetical protein